MSNFIHGVKQTTLVRINSLNLTFPLPPFSTEHWVLQKDIFIFQWDKHVNSRSRAKPEDLEFASSPASTVQASSGKSFHEQSLSQPCFELEHIFTQHHKLQHMKNLFQISPTNKVTCTSLVCSKLQWRVCSESVLNLISFCSFSFWSIKQN